MDIENDVPMDVTHEATNIIEAHTSGFMSSTSYKPLNDEELLETMICECGFILTGRLIDKTYTPMQYNDIRNEIAGILNNIFFNQDNDTMKGGE